MKTKTIPRKYRVYADIEAFKRAARSWKRVDFGYSLRDPVFRKVDDSFDWAAHGLEGTELCSHIEVDDEIRNNARVDFLVEKSPRAELPVPPREIEFKYDWDNAPRWHEEHRADLPAYMTLYCHLELTSVEIHVVEGCVAGFATYSYQYSTEPVLDDDEEH